MTTGAFCERQQDAEAFPAMALLDEGRMARFYKANGSDGRSSHDLQTRSACGVMDC